MKSGIFEKLGIDPAIVMLFLFLVILLLVIFVIRMSMQMDRINKKYRAFMGGKDAISLEREFSKKFNELTLLTESNQNHREEIRKIKEIQNLSKNKVGIVKYDAFQDIGGKLSFALAMLDKENNGFILNVIHNRDGCYTYIKEIVKGESYIVLGDEEKEALGMAVSAFSEIENMV